MHVGLRYPYNWEIWSVTALWWPGYAPRNVTVGMPLVMPVGLTFLAGWNAISGIGTPSGDGERLAYQIVDLPTGVASAEAFLETRLIGTVKWYDANVVITMDDSNVLGIGASLIAPRYNPLMNDLYYRELNGSPIFPVYVGGSIAPTPWYDLDPPADNFNLGRWIKDGSTP